MSPEEVDKATELMSTLYEQVVEEDKDVAAMAIMSVMANIMMIADKDRYSLVMSCPEDWMVVACDVTSCGTKENAELIRDIRYPFLQRLRGLVFSDEDPELVVERIRSLLPEEEE